MENLLHTWAANQRTSLWVKIGQRAQPCKLVENLLVIGYKICVISMITYG